SYLNSWTASSTLSRRLYSHGSMVYCDFSITGGTLPTSGGSIAPFSLPVATDEGKEFPIFYQVGNAYNMARGRITGSGNFQILGVTDNTLVAGSFFYRMRA